MWLVIFAVGWLTLLLCLKKLHIIALKEMACALTINVTFPVILLGIIFHKTTNSVIIETLAGVSEGKHTSGAPSVIIEN